MTVQTYALIVNNEVQNVCQWDGETLFDPGRGTEIVAISDLPKGIWIGWIRADDGTWSAPDDNQTL